MLLSLKLFLLEDIIWKTALMDVLKSQSEITNLIHVVWCSPLSDVEFEDFSILIKKLPILKLNSGIHVSFQCTVIPSH